MAKINVALIGQGFMGRSHSGAWGQAACLFKPPLQPVMHTVSGQPDESPQAFADNWGWRRACTDWEQAVRSPEIGLVDVVTPNYMHAPVAKAEFVARKSCACEKRVAGSLADARAMVEAARKAGAAVDGAVLFLAGFSGGAAASFEAARQATGKQNRNTFEINGTKGSVRFDFERMNELRSYDATLPRAVQGWGTLTCTHGGDCPYVANWWPNAHVIGYEHEFAKQSYNTVRTAGGLDKGVVT